MTRPHPDGFESKPSEITDSSLICHRITFTEERLHSDTVGGLLQSLCGTRVEITHMFKIPHGQTLVNQ